MPGKILWFKNSLYDNIEPKSMADIDDRLIYSVTPISSDQKLIIQIQI